MHEILKGIWPVAAADAAATADAAVPHEFGQCCVAVADLVADGTLLPMVPAVIM